MRIRQKGSSSGGGKGQGNGGGWPSTTGNPSGGGRSNGRTLHVDDEDDDQPDTSQWMPDFD